jgi:putative membrane protein
VIKNEHQEDKKMMHWGNFGAGFGGFGLGWIFMILFWAFVILGVVYLIKQLSGGSKTTINQETAKDILKKRYASGEITKEEYREKAALIFRP